MVLNNCIWCHTSPRKNQPQASKRNVGSLVRRFWFVTTRSMSCCARIVLCSELNAQRQQVNSVTIQHFVRDTVSHCNSMATTGTTALRRWRFRAASAAPSACARTARPALIDLGPVPTTPTPRLTVRVHDVARV